MSEKLEIRNISKSYVENGVLDNISFDIHNGEFLSILGASGCGKTTLLRILIGLLKPDFGKIYKDGVDITNVSADKRGMGIVFQNYALFENMSVFSNVEYALKFRKDLKQHSRKIALEILDAVGLGDKLNYMPVDLSGGQQQRVAIARTLALKSDIILLDEPMSALDVANRISMRDELKRIQKKFNTTMIYVTHDQEEAFAMSDRIMILQNGRICQIDTPENICDNPSCEYVKTFVLDNLQAKVDSLSRYISRKM